MVLVGSSKDRILLGHITGVSGLKGWVKVHSDTQPRDNITGYKSWWLGRADTWKEVRVLDGRPQGKTIIARLEGFDSRELASELIGAQIAVDRSTLPTLPDGEYYWTDLTGMHVKTVDETDIGPVSRLFETGANDVLVVSDKREADTPADAAKASTGGRRDKEVLVPWLVPEVIRDVDMENRIITVDWDPDF